MILDTNALSALAEQDPNVIRKLRETRRLAVTLITIGEFTFGIRQSRKRKELETWFAALLKRVEVLCPNLETMDQYAAIRIELVKSGTPIPANDCWIAALVRQHHLPILSRDRHFDNVDQVRRLDW